MTAPDPPIPGGPDDQDPIPQRRETGRARHHQGRTEPEGDGDRYPYGYGKHCFLVQDTDRFGRQEDGQPFWEWVCKCPTRSVRPYSSETRAYTAGTNHAAGRDPVGPPPRQERTELPPEAFFGGIDRRDQKGVSGDDPGSDSSGQRRFRGHDDEPVQPDSPPPEAWDRIKRGRERRRGRRREGE